jgi:hypothetical protein
VILLATYDLHNPGRDYDAIVNVLKSADSWAHPQGSVWLLDTLKEPSTWRDALRAAGDKNDEYFVTRLAHSWASTNMDTNVVTWLKDPGRRW